MKSKFINFFKIFTGKIPGQLIIQITNCCNGTCPQCGMKKSAKIKRYILSTDVIKTMIDQCAVYGFEAVSFTGGEPFIDESRLFELLDYAGKVKIPFLRTGTNGFMFLKSNTAYITDFVKRLSLTKLRNFWISLDSADTETHETMRGLPGVIAGIKLALPVFHAYGIYPAVNLGINRNILGDTISELKGTDDRERFFNNFKKGFMAFFQKAIDLGFTMANVCYPMSSDNSELEISAYGAISDNFIVSFSEEELSLVFKALMETIPIFRSKIRIFTPLSVLYAMSNENDSLLFPCMGGINFFYADSRNGYIYPCGFLGEKDLGEDLRSAISIGSRKKPHCMKCYWECFRDPSQLFSIAHYVINHPIRVFFKKKVDPMMIKFWIEDLNYYLKHDFFNGRIPFKWYLGDQKVIKQ